MEISNLRELFTSSRKRKGIIVKRTLWFYLGVLVSLLVAMLISIGMESSLAISIVAVAHFFLIFTYTLVLMLVFLLKERGALINIALIVVIIGASLIGTYRRVAFGIPKALFSTFLQR